jgi:hypothetical protein
MQQSKEQKSKERYERWLEDQGLGGEKRGTVGQWWLSIGNAKYTLFGKKKIIFRLCQNVFSK